MLRDVWHQSPELTFFLVFLGGMCLGHWAWFFPINGFGLVAILFAGSVIGHLLWGKKYVPYQGR